MLSGIVQGVLNTLGRYKPQVRLESERVKNRRFGHTTGGEDLPVIVNVMGAISR